MRLVAAAALVAGLLPAAGTAAAEESPDAVMNTPSGQRFDRFIVDWDKDAGAQRSDRAAERSSDAAARGRGHEMRFERRMGGSATVMRTEQPVSRAEADELVAALEQRDDVASAEVDVLLQPTVEPDDPRYPEQWHYMEPTAGLNLPTAWDIADGSGATVAVIDTGITSHPDLDANVVGGYDFISDAEIARDGGGRDGDPADEGDWYASGECGVSGSANSSWHGTHVAGTVAAVTDDGAGVAGVAHGAQVVPLRVLGKCGGYTSDIADAIRWAGGGTVSGVPSNPNPADVINLSLGGSGSCGATTQSAIDSAVANGATVVVAAGNSNTNAANANPANCNNVVAVASVGRTGGKAYYSNYGAVVDVAAPGGDTSSGTSDGVLSTLNRGTTTPASPTHGFYQGTSMAAPHVAGLAALMIDADASLSPAEVESTIVSSARSFPATCNQCGSGIADATAALAALSGSPDPEPDPDPGDGTYANDTDVAIPDLGTAESPINVDRAGAAPADLVVSVDIDHTYRGDLVIDLVAPNGATARLKDSDGWDGADGVDQSWTVDASSVQAAGTWRLGVRDVYRGDTGTIRSWSLAF